MGALAPLSSWFPQDDLLLKNALEAGASLESLAKGVVQFSRRFTVQELQDRWFSLLYDPVVSAEACARMIEFENSGLPLPVKPQRCESSKEIACASGKRKVDSVRKCYYAMRKRICNEPFGSMDLSFLAEPGNSNCMANHDEPPSANFLVLDPTSNHFGASDSNFDTVNHAFQQCAMGTTVAGGDINVTSHTLYTGFQNLVEDLPMDQNHMHGHNLQPKELPFEANDSEAEHLAVYDQSISPVNLCSVFGGTQALHSPISDCGASFHNLVYSSPLPQMPIWSTTEGTSAPTLPDVHPSEDERLMGDTFSLPGNHYRNNTDTCELKNQMRRDNNMKNSTPGPDDYLAVISETLFNFTSDEELLYIDDDGKDGISKSYIDGFGSLLLDSPNLDGISNIPGGEPSVASDGHIAILRGVCSLELDESGQPHHGDRHTVSQNPKFPEPPNGVICCMLNTEDPEIPCNDDVFPPNRMLTSSSLSSIPQGKFDEVNCSISSFNKDSSGNQNSDPTGPSLIKREGKIFGKSCSSSKMIRSQVVPEKGLNRPVDDRGVKYEFPNGDYSAIVDTEMEQAKSLVPLINGPSTIPNHQTSHVESSFVEITVSEPVIKHSPYKQEEPPSESDGDVPYFSDVEAVILDMDLSLDDPDLHSSREVPRYQHEDSKRAIIRLEQAAHSYMQRLITSRGAFAVLYGRHSKHYIKKPEVLVGRATEDVQVDVDLGREGRASKISRRQAIIKMDEGGFFYMKNLGKCPIFINSREVASRQSLSLTSGCVVEIRGLPFIFETNQTCIKQYVDNTIKQSKTQEHNKQL